MTTFSLDVEISKIIIIIKKEQDVSAYRFYLLYRRVTADDVQL